MDNDKLFKLFSELRSAELNAGRKRHNSLIHIYFLFGMMAGIVFNLSSNILNRFGELLPGNYYEISILVLTVLLILFIFYHLSRRYFAPLKQAESEVDDILQKITSESIK
jgi:hypothetical protein